MLNLKSAPVALMVILHRWMSKPRLPALTRDDCRDRSRKTSPTNLRHGARRCGSRSCPRRRDLESREESWLVYYGDVHVGECTNGSAATFDQARADFEQAWAVFLSNRTEADFREWRDARDWTAWKYALWDAGRRLEPPSYGPGKPAHRFRKCPCGEVFDMHGPEEVFVHVPHITATEAVLSARRHAEALHDSACPNART